MVSDDDVIEEGEGAWFSTEMTKAKKMEAKKPWRLSIIIKLVGMSIGYQYLLKKIQLMWRIQQNFTLINLSNDYFIVRLTSKQDYETAMFEVLGYR